MSAELSFATLNPKTLSNQNIGTLCNLVNGTWCRAQTSREVVDPLNGDVFLHAPDTSEEELAPFVESLAQCPKTGLHNPFKNVERYRLYGQISAKVAGYLRDEKVADFFARCIQRVVPKSLTQAKGEVTILANFLENFSGDQVRFLAEGFSRPGDYQGQRTHGHRWPYGPVAIVSPFNFPLEIPGLQLMGALYMGNKVVIKNATSTSMVLEQFIRLLHHCGMPKTDVDLIYCRGSVMGELLKQAPLRSIQFTGSSKVAEELAKIHHGKVFIEDAGFDWKIMGPDVDHNQIDYVSWQCDQDAYAASGQKCSAQSILFLHQNWVKTGFVKRLEALAKRRNLHDLTVGPVLTQTTEHMLHHIEQLLSIPGASLLFGGQELQQHNIPSFYGALEPTAVYVPLEELQKPEYFPLATKEIFGPFQVITYWKDDQIDHVLQICENMDHHLTAAIVSNDPQFVNHVLAHTVNGTTYAGLRARTTGAPQNHWFGPAGDPRAAGIGTPEAIRLVWSCHREIVEDYGPSPTNWTLPPAS